MQTAVGLLVVACRPVSPHSSRLLGLALRLSRSCPVDATGKFSPRLALAHEAVRGNTFFTSLLFVSLWHSRFCFVGSQFLDTTLWHSRISGLCFLLLAFHTAFYCGH